MAWLFEQVVLNGKPGRQFWWIAPVFAQAKIAYGRMKRGLPREMVKWNDTDQTITLIANEAVLSFKSGEKPDNLYGEDVFAAVMDEASRMREESYYAVRSTLTATQGPIRIIGNVKGRKNWFYIGCRKAEGGGPVTPVTRSSPPMPSLPASSRRRGNPFGIKYSQACIGPVSKKPSTAFGADLAKSIDWTVTHGLDEDGCTTEHHRFQLPWRPTMDRLRLICGHTTTVVDSTGVGDPVVEELQDENPESIFQGFKFSAQTKQMLVEGLAVAIQHNEIQYPDGVIVSELESFEYEYIFGSPGPVRP